MLCAYGHAVTMGRVATEETGKDSAREIREYFIPDFSNWKNHDAYQPAFDRLLHDLKAEAPPAAGTAP